MDRTANVGCDSEDDAMEMESFKSADEEVASLNEYKICKAKPRNSPIDRTTVVRDSTTVSFELIPKRGSADRSPFFEFLREFRLKHNSLGPRDLLASACYVWKKLPAFRKLIYKTIHVDETKNDSPWTDRGTPPPCPVTSPVSDIMEANDGCVDSINLNEDDEFEISSIAGDKTSPREEFPSLREEFPISKTCGSCTPSFCSAPPQSSSKCQMSTPFRPTCSRQVCRRPRKRHLIGQLQPKKKKSLPRRVPRRRRVKKPKKKPAWMTNFHVSPDIWQFLKNMREKNANLCLEEFLTKCATTYNPAAVAEATRDIDRCDTVSTEGSFRSAASYARSLSQISEVSLPSFRSQQSKRSVLAKVSPPVVTAKDLPKRCTVNCRGCSTCKTPGNVTAIDNDLDLAFEINESMMDCPSGKGSRCPIVETTMPGSSQKTTISIPCNEDVS